MGLFMIQKARRYLYMMRNLRLWTISLKSCQAAQFLSFTNSNTTKNESSSTWGGVRFWGVALVRRDWTRSLSGLMLEVSPSSLATLLVWGMDLTYKDRADTLYGSEYHGILSTTTKPLLEYIVRGKRVIVYSFTTSPPKTP